jgi:hypothetical protein
LFGNIAGTYFIKSAIVSAASVTSLGITVSVMRVPARGAMQLVLMFLFSPSLARAWVKPQSPSLAVE